MPSIKPIVYICAPYSGTPEEIQRNVENVKRYCRFAADQGYAPIATHLAICGFLRDEIAQERELGIEIDKTLLSVCSELWVFGDRISTGMNDFPADRKACPLFHRNLRSTHHHAFHAGSHRPCQQAHRRMGER